MKALKKAIDTTSKEAEPSPACRPRRVWDRSAPSPSRPLRGRWSSSNEVAISPPGSASCRGGSGPAASSGSGRSQGCLNATFPRLLIIGAIAVVRWALRHGAPQNPWLARMLQRKPPMVAAFALVNKMARGIWAMLTRSEIYRGPVTAA
jgi:hypothetical protein